jgi:hypothetical protein
VRVAEDGGRVQQGAFVLIEDALQGQRLAAGAESDALA